MTTYNISNPEPSEAAKAVLKEDGVLRKWLGVGALDRAFVPFWDQAGTPSTPSAREPRGPIDNGWGKPFDLADFLEDLFGVGTATTAPKTPPKSAT